ncbi:hypothetical protein ONZ51_g4349 [Trametes cubensis]|uniref:Protein kinase domain-containing protein n=1 Tax=Trametes cubensis TaxID=1111947 RepID=A0AAD7TYG9_9APHY|nr:hypothetical protein ONZ51_g4349 [Trametes cubensis]
MILPNAKAWVGSNRDQLVTSGAVHIPKRILVNPADTPVRACQPISQRITRVTRIIKAEVARTEAMEEAQPIRFVPTREFLDRIMPVDSEELDQIYHAVMRHKDQLYAHERWQTFPQAKGQYEELDVYPAFVKTANAIANEARVVSGERADQVREATWVDYHSRALHHLKKDATEDRPHCALAMAAVDPLEASSETSDKSRWLQFVTAVEAKRDYDQDDKELISRLLTYLRLIMGKQRDRRFAFGLFLSTVQVSVWLQDRSGVLGMDVPINIHENPKDFIQAIAAFAILPAHRLGFDPTMKLTREPLPPIHTYRLTSQGPDRFTLEQYKMTNDVTQWVITTEQGTFITARVLNAPRTDAASGSGCIVWAAIQYEDRAVDPDKRKVFVIKQLWKSDRQVDEGATYEHIKSVSAACNHPDAQCVGKLEFYEIVKIGGELDNTDGLIRRGLEPVQLRMDERRQSRKRARSAKPEMGEWFHIEVTNVNGIEVVSHFVAGRQEATGALKRTRVRIVLGVFGCSVKFFSSVQELISILSQCVRGHRFAYKHGVVHRDISPANLLIALTGDDITPSSRSDPYDVRGCLIDFDHAKRTRTVEERKVAFDADEARRLTKMSVYHTCSEDWEERVTDEVVHRAVHLVKRRYPNESSPSKITQLATQSVAERTGEVRSGTPPYISVKILNGPDEVFIHWNGISFPPSNSPHDAIHNMESFFWVLLFLCITRAGPGGERRKDLICKLNEIPVEQKMQVAPLHDLVYRLFDGDMADIASYKKGLFKQPQNFEEQILCHIHPYFDVLKPTLRRWWNLLVLAYAFEGYEYHNIHTFVLELLEQAAVELAVVFDARRSSSRD